MPAPGLSNAQRAQRALEELEHRGGSGSLPDVLKSADVIPLMGKGWFGDALRLDLMPGMRATRGGVWRCERDAFVTWLQGMAVPEVDEALEGDNRDGTTR